MDLVIFRIFHITKKICFNRREFSNEITELKERFQILFQQINFECKTIDTKLIAEVILRRKFYTTSIGKYSLASMCN